MDSKEQTIEKIGKWLHDYSNETELTWENEEPADKQYWINTVYCLLETFPSVVIIEGDGEGQITPREFQAVIDKQCRGLYDDLENEKQEFINNLIKVCKDFADTFIRKTKYVDDELYIQLLQAQKTLTEKIEREKYEQEKNNWVDKPDKAGRWWMSPYNGGLYARPMLIEVFKYDDGGMEVRESGDDWINLPSIEEFTTDYYPKAKYLYIETPNWESLKKQIGGA